jgi:hypothetical protein
VSSSAKKERSYSSWSVDRVEEGFVKVVREDGDGSECCTEAEGSFGRE